MLFVSLLVSCIPRCNSEEMITIETHGRGAFKNAIDYGILIPGKTNFTFSVKTCAEGVIVFSDIVVVSNSVGNYFLVMLGTEENTQITITDSCFRCNRSKTINEKIMKCDTFIDFWSKFDGKGNIELGRGKKIGEDSLLTFTSTRSKVYNVYNIAFTSTNENIAIWKIPKEELKPSLYQPIRKGHTIVEMTDADEVGRVVIDIIVVHEKRPERFSLIENTSDSFRLEGNTVKLAAQLSLTQPFHIVRLRSDSGFATSFTVVVKPFTPLPNNSKPIANVDDVITIPEDTPIGSLIGWNLTVSDVDKHDVAMLNISGDLGAYFRVTEKRELMLSRTLDREAFDHQPSFTLTVADIKPNVVNVTVTVNITDVNDNIPECGKDVFVLNVEEMPEEDKEILTLSFTDKDEGPNGKVEMSLVKDQESQSNFFIRNASLFVKSGALDYETSQVTTVFIGVRDSPESDIRNTITLIVIIKILPKDESPPVWVSPKMATKEEFLDVYVLVGSPPGSLVTSFKARDEDEGEGDITYSLGGTESGFKLSEKTGHLTLLDGIGDDAFNFNLDVFAKSGNRQIKGVLKVNFIESIESPVQSKPKNNELHFNKNVYVIDRPSSGDWRTSLLNFQLVNHNLRDRTNVSIQGEGEKYFRLRFSLSSWKLYLKAKATIEDIPSSVVLTASFPTGTVSARVLIRSQVAVCDVPVTIPATTVREEVTTLRQFRAAPTTTASRRRERRCIIEDDTSEHVLVTLIVGESLALAAIFLLRNTFQERRSGTRRRNRNIRKKPEPKKVKKTRRKEPLGCERGIAVNESLRKPSIPKDFETQEGPMTLAEIEEDEETLCIVGNGNDKSTDKQGTDISETGIVEAVDNATSNVTSGVKVKDDDGNIRCPPELSEAHTLDEIKSGQESTVKQIPDANGTEERKVNTVNYCPSE